MEFVAIYPEGCPNDTLTEQIIMNWEPEAEDALEEDELDQPDRSASHLSPTDYPTSRVLLTAAQEIELAEQAQAGDLISRNRMVEANIRLVISIARRYTCRSMTLEDLIQEGVFGLVEAIEKFDTTRGYKFSTYATYWVRQGIMRAIEKQDRMIRLPSYGCNASWKLHQIEPKLRGKLGREPTVEELAVETGLSRRLIRVLQEVIHEPVSLDVMLGADEDTTLGELLADEEALEPEDQAVQGMARRQMLEVIDELPPREALVIKKRYGLLGDGRVYSLQEISEELGMSREGVRHMQNRSLRRLRQMFKVPEPETKPRQYRKRGDP